MENRISILLPGFSAVKHIHKLLGNTMNNEMSSFVSNKKIIHIVKIKIDCKMLQKTLMTIKW